jgi:Kef-type K+ transport system membrane component KefB
MGPCGLGLFSDLNDMESLADFGVLFLLFEQGLELTVCFTFRKDYNRALIYFLFAQVDRLRGLSRFAFGMGSLQVLLSSLAFSVFPFVGGVKFLEYFCGAEAGVVDITRVDEALVIGAALSLSSSAFVLQILQVRYAQG